MLPRHLVAQHTLGGLVHVCAADHHTDLVRLLQIHPQRPIARRNLLHHGVDQGGGHLPLDVADIFLGQVLPVLVADHVKTAIDGRVGLFEYHVHLGGELHVPHHRADAVHGAYAGAVSHKLQTDLLEMAALRGHSYRLRVEDLAFAVVHIKADGADDLASFAGQQFKNVDTAHQADTQLQGKGPELSVDVDGDARHIQCVRDKRQRRGVALLIAGELDAAVLHVVNVVPMNL